MEIIQHVEAPAELVRLIEDHYKNIHVVDKVLIIGGMPLPLENVPLLKNKMGIFVPGTRSVIIDMKACMTDQQWMAKGMTYITNVWCNLIYTAFHEAAHAHQVMDHVQDWDEATWEVQREILDHNADIEALELTVDWFAKHQNVPSIRGLGWVGQQIQVLFNNLYSEAPDQISQEMELWGAGMLAVAAAQSPNLKGDIEMLSLPQEYKDAPEIIRLFDAIDTGNAGMIINGKRCLRVGEALELSINKHRS